jgi:hypothetical protein
MRITHDQAILAVQILINLSDRLKHKEGKTILLALERPIRDKIVKLSNEIENND